MPPSSLLRVPLTAAIASTELSNTVTAPFLLLRAFQMRRGVASACAVC